MRYLYAAARIATTEASSRPRRWSRSSTPAISDGCCAASPGIGREIPAAGQPVGVQDHQRIAGEVVGELADARRDVSGRAVVRDHVARLAGIDEQRADVAEPDEAHDARRGVDPRDRHRGAARRRKRAMDPLDDVLACRIRVLAENVRTAVSAARAASTPWPEPSTSMIVRPARLSLHAQLSPQTGSPG